MSLSVVETTTTTMVDETTTVIINNDEIANKEENRRDNGGDLGEHEESDEHLKRVQVELDKLNYANESINSLELELEESKREYLMTMQESEEELTILEKRLGSCVEKAKPYYEARIELNDAKEKYLKVLADNLNF